MCIATSAAEVDDEDDEELDDELDELGLIHKLLENLNIEQDSSTGNCFSQV